MEQKKQRGAVAQKEGETKKAFTPQRQVHALSLKDGISIESEKLQKELLRAWNGLQEFPITETIEVNEHAGLEVAGDFVKDTGVRYYLIENSGKVKDVFRKSGAKDALPKTDGTIFFQNYFRTNTAQFSPIIGLKSGLNCVAFTVVKNKGGQYSMVNVFIPFEDMDKASGILGFIINQVF